MEGLQPSNNSEFEMNKIVHRARLVLAHVCAWRKAYTLAVATLIAFAYPAAAQQTAATAAMGNEQVLAECRRIFDGKTFVGVIKNSDFYRYASGRREVTIYTSVKGELRAVDGRVVCPVTVRSEDDGRNVRVSEYLFDGMTATRPDINSERAAVTLTPRGKCVFYQGTYWMEGALRNAGESLQCPR